MKKKENNKKVNSPYIRRLGRMTDEEYEAMWDGENKVLKNKPQRRKDLRRLTDEEYRDLPYGNSAFYKQFKK